MYTSLSKRMQVILYHNKCMSLNITMTSQDSGQCQLLWNKRSNINTQDILAMTRVYLSKWAHFFISSWHHLTNAGTVKHPFLFLSYMFTISRISEVVPGTDKEKASYTQVIPELFSDAKRYRKKHWPMVISPHIYATDLTAKVQMLVKAHFHIS